MFRSRKLDSGMNPEKRPPVIHRAARLLVIIRNYIIIIITDWSKALKEPFQSSIAIIHPLSRESSSLVHVHSRILVLSCPVLLTHAMR